MWGSSKIHQQDDAKLTDTKTLVVVMMMMMKPETKKTNIYLKLTSRDPNFLFWVDFIVIISYRVMSHEESRSKDIRIISLNESAKESFDWRNFNESLSRRKRLSHIHKGINNHTSYGLFSKNTTRMLIINKREDFFFLLR